MVYLTGEYFHKLDAKNRIRIPAKLKKELGDSYYFTKGTDGCLFIFPQAVVQEKIAVLEEVKLSDERQKGVRAFIKSLVPAEEDNQGRLVLNPALKAFAGIKDDVVFCGSGSRIDLWAKERYDEYFADTDENFDDLIKELDI